MPKAKDASNVSRVRKLENNLQAPDQQVITVDWDNTPDAELPAGTLVIEWEQDGSISSHRVKPNSKR